MYIELKRVDSQRPNHRRWRASLCDPGADLSNAERLLGTVSVFIPPNDWGNPPQASLCFDEEGGLPSVWRGGLSALVKAMRQAEQNPEADTFRVTFRG